MVHQKNQPALHLRCAVRRILKILQWYDCVLSGRGKNIGKMRNLYRGNPLFLIIYRKFFDGKSLLINNLEELNNV